MAQLHPLKLYNTLTRQKSAFTPRDWRDAPGIAEADRRVRMYVCGPTVYDYAHIGNARPAIVFDVLYRLLRHVYGETHVVYARNITDVDDKINARAARDFPGVPLNEAIAKVTAVTDAQYQHDVTALGCLPPTFQPHATEYIAEMRVLIDQLVSRGHAYVADGHVLFDVSSMPDYGRLANRSLDEMEAGARVDVAPYKKGPMDFVLWKPSKPGEPSWSSPAGLATAGRPGWHVECSAMAGALLGEVFDIHAGGIDLVFPHHENEVAQSRCAHGTSVMAEVWMHNGFLQVEGEKMSKSLGNFITINELLATEKFGGQKWHGRVLRLAMLATHYRQPIDWTVERLNQAKGTLEEFAELARTAPAGSAPNDEVIAALADDLNTPSAISILHGIARSAKRGDAVRAGELRATLEFAGLWNGEAAADLDLAPVADVDATAVEALVTARLAARKARNFAESDRIRDQLAAMGIQIKDGKDPATGEAFTTWEAMR
ncbi:MAG: cysteine--tRNA ligase [Hyphomicrobiaceae bacterium]